MPKWLLKILMTYMCHGPGAAQNNRNVCLLIIETTIGCRKILIPLATSSKEIGASVSFVFLINPCHWVCLV